MSDEIQCKRMGLVHKASVSYCSLGLLLNSSTGAARINPGHGTKIARGLDGYMGYQHKFMSIKSMGLLKPGATRCHGTRIARGVPLPVYNNLDLYSGFWCTSRCVVFKYSVPPLTDQALRKVLLTS